MNRSARPGPAHRRARGPILLAGCGGDDGGGGAAPTSARSRPGRHAASTSRRSIRPEGELQDEHRDAGRQRRAASTIPATRIVEPDRTPASPSDGEEPHLRGRHRALAGREGGDLRQRLRRRRRRERRGHRRDHRLRRRPGLHRQGDRGRATQDGSYEGVRLRGRRATASSPSASSTTSSSSPNEQTFKAAVDASGGDVAGRRRRVLRHGRRGARGQPRRRLRGHRGLIDQAGAGRRPGDAPVLRARSADEQSRTATALASLVPRLGPGRDRLQRRPRRRRGLRERRPQRASSAASRPTRSPPSSRRTSATQIKQVIDQLDATGIPGEVPPGQLKQQPASGRHRPRRASPARSATSASSSRAPSATTSAARSS